MSGFHKPHNVSHKLRTFLSLEEGERISRAEVTRRINAYVHSNNLSNDRYILLDDKLTELLEPPRHVQLTFLSMQKYLFPHFIKEKTVEDLIRDITEDMAHIKETQIRLKEKIDTLAAQLTHASLDDIDY
jgi:chromatin remodeling complex protein RSC6